LNFSVKVPVPLARWRNGGARDRRGVADALGRAATVALLLTAVAKIDRRSSSRYAARAPRSPTEQPPALPGHAYPGVSWLGIGRTASAGRRQKQWPITRTSANGAEKTLVDRDGQKIGKLEDVYVDVETDEPMFGTVKEGLIGRHLTFVPLAGITIGPDDLQMAVTKEQVKSAPNIELHGDELSRADESALYHHYQLNYTPPDTERGRRLARR
jgi:hypothetical protein